MRRMGTSVDRYYNLSKHLSLCEKLFLMFLHKFVVIPVRYCVYKRYIISIYLWAHIHESKEKKSFLLYELVKTACFEFSFLCLRSLFKGPIAAKVCLHTF